MEVCPPNGGPAVFSNGTSKDHGNAGDQPTLANRKRRHCVHVCQMSRRSKTKVSITTALLTLACSAHLCYAGIFFPSCHCAEEGVLAAEQPLVTSSLDLFPSCPLRLPHSKKVAPKLLAVVK